MVLSTVKALGKIILPRRVRFLAARFRRERVLFDTRTPFNHLRVVDKGGTRYLVFVDHSGRPASKRPEHIYQSCMRLEDPLRSTAPYLDFFHLPLLFNPDLSRVLMIGLGGGTTARRFLADYANMQVDAVEIDPVVIEVAQAYFGLPTDQRLKVYQADGREFVQKPGKDYELVIIDAFLARAVPHHLVTIEFLEELSARLTPRGMVIINVNGTLCGPRSKLFRCIYATFRAAFPQVYVFAWRQEAPETYQNIAVLAHKEPVGLNPAQLRFRARRLTGTLIRVNDFADRVNCLYRGPINLTGIEPFTDRDRPQEGLLDLYELTN